MPASPLPLRGAARPRVEVAPPSDYTEGDQAAAIAAAAGLVLDPWQLSGLRAMLSVRADRRWACFEYGEICARQNGKTTAALARALAGMFLLNEQLVLWTAHEVKTGIRSWRDLRTLLRTLGEPVNDHLVVIDGEIPVKIDAATGAWGFERLDTGQEIRVVARSKGSGRGFSTDCLIIDEAFAYEEQHQDALMPTLSARPNAQIVYLSSPPLNGSSGEPMYALRKRAEAGGDETLGWRDWGLSMHLDTLMAMPPAERAAVLDDRSLWAATNPAAGLGRVDEESILRLRRSMSEEGFAREVLGMWPRQVTEGGGWLVIPEQPWRARGGAAGRPDKDVTFCLDASWPSAAMGAIAVAGQLGGELVVQVVEHRAGTGWMVERARELRARWPRAKWVLDKAGPAGHLKGELEDEGFELAIPSVGDLARAHGLLVAAVVGDRPWLRHFDQPELDAAVRAAGTRTLGDGQTWARQGEADISPLTAVTGAVLLAARRPVAPPPAPVPVTTRSETGDLMTIGF